MMGMVVMMGMLPALHLPSRWLLRRPCAACQCWPPGRDGTQYREHVSQACFTHRPSLPGRVNPSGRSGSRFPSGYWMRRCWAASQNSITVRDGTWYRGLASQADPNRRLSFPSWVGPVGHYVAGFASAERT